MNKLTRRAFGKRLLVAGALPLLDGRTAEGQVGNDVSTVVVPDVIAGYTLSAEEKQLAAKFLSVHEKNMSPLREQDLPNHLAPDFRFSSPKSKGESGAAKR
jgi:hypothetical protein